MRLRSPLVGVVLACLSAGGCSNQLLIDVFTDAPLPSAGDSPVAEDRPWLFDQLLVEIFEARADRLHRFEVHQFLLDDRFLRGRLPSFALLPRPDERWLMRLRIFRGGTTRITDPTQSESIEGWFEVPAAPVQEELYAPMLTDEVGRPRGTAATPSPLALDAPKARRPWSPAPLGRRCGGEAPAGTLCVPGGAFWMGDRALAGVSGLDDVSVERLVLVSPFYLDQVEVTIAAFRRQRDLLRARGELLPPDTVPREGDDRMPVSEVSWHTARAYCQLAGGDLPTEAMWEFVASGRGQEFVYPWGNNEPRCDRVVFARQISSGLFDQCPRASDVPGPEPANAESDDWAAVPGGEVRDLAGNVTEWTRDEWSPPHEGIWVGTGLLTDPGPPPPLDATGRRFTVKGGSWRSSRVEARAAARSPRPGNTTDRSLGFRCAWPARLP